MLGTAETGGSLPVTDAAKLLSTLISLRPEQGAYTVGSREIKRFSMQSFEISSEFEGREFV